MTFDDGVLVVLNDGMIVISMEPTVVQFKTTSCGANHNLTNHETQDTYINACYIDEALLVDETEDAFKIYMSEFMIVRIIVMRCMMFRQVLKHGSALFRVIKFKTFRTMPKKVKISFII